MLAHLLSWGDTPGGVRPPSGALVGAFLGGATSPQRSVPGVWGWNPQLTFARGRQPFSISAILKPMPHTVLMYSPGAALDSLARRLLTWTFTVLSSPMNSSPHTDS